jgi:hypothetical protein
MAEAGDIVVWGVHWSRRIPPPFIRKPVKYKTTVHEQVHYRTDNSDLPQIGVIGNRHIPDPTFQIGVDKIEICYRYLFN